MRHEAIFLDKPVVTDELDKPAPKKPYNDKKDSEKQVHAARARRWSESIAQSIELPLNRDSIHNH
jgi:hypothetical protein